MPTCSGCTTLTFVSSKVSLTAQLRGSSPSCNFPPGAFHFPAPNKPSDFLSKRTLLSLTMKQRVARIVNVTADGSAWLFLFEENNRLCEVSSRLAECFCGFLS